MSKRFGSPLIAIALAVALGVPPAIGADLSAGEQLSLANVQPSVDDAGGMGPPGQFLTSAAETNSDDILARLNKLEESVKKAEAKAAEDKAKAASKPTVSVGGRTFVDLGLISQDALNKATYGNMTNSANFRAVRIKVEGKAFDTVEYVTSFDFASQINDADGDQPVIGNGVSFKDVYMTLTELPTVGNIRIGQMKEPYNLENWTSNRFITFMTRNMAQSLWTPDRTLGVMAFNWTENKRMTWQLGAFQNDISQVLPRRDSDNLATAVTARATALPWYDEATEGRGLLHLGAAYSYRNAFGNGRRFRSTPDLGFGGSNAFVLNGGAPLLTDYQLYGLEMIWIYGPLSIQSEYMGASLNYPTATGTRDLRDMYVMISYFLTGENRSYKRETAVIDRVKPYENFFRVRTEDDSVQTGWGAWELAYRYDYADIYAMGSTAGLAGAHTFGVNWYLNSYTRFMWDYVHADCNKSYKDAGAVDSLMMRAQVEF